MSYSLFLYATAPLVDDLTADAIVDWLTLQGLIRSGQTAPPFTADERLMEFINYLGCSPILTAGGIEAALLVHRFERLTGLGGDSVVTLRYPGCGHVIEDPARLLQAGDPERCAWRCAECGNEGLAQDINWRKSAGFSNCFIEISGIFPKEALPNDALLRGLADLSGSDWQWFYSRSSQPQA